MRFGNLAVPFGTFASLAVAVDDWMGCDYRKFCSRHRDYLKLELDNDKLNQSFHIDQNTISFDGGSLYATLKRDQAISTWWTADKLDFTMTLYQDGIARIMVEEPHSGRFRVSQQPIL